MNTDSDDIILNRVASSGLITLDLETYLHPGEQVAFDIKNWLFREMILKEKEFRELVSQHNWSQYSGKNLAFFCSTDAIVPTWAYMLLAIHAEPFVNRYVFGSIEQLQTILLHDALAQIDWTIYSDKRVIVKGCGEKGVPVNAYVEITHKLMPHAKSIMYGEACSNVPLFKRR